MIHQSSAKTQRTLRTLPGTPDRRWTAASIRLSPHGSTSQRIHRCWGRNGSGRVWPGPTSAASSRTDCGGCREDRGLLSCLESQTGKFKAPTFH